MRVETGIRGAFSDVVRFMRAMDQDVRDAPAMPDKETQVLRLGLVREEVTELLDANLAGDLPAIADAIGDAIYVLLGMGAAYGIDIPACWDAIQAANLAKLGGPKCPETAKQLKPAGWRPPDIAGILRDQRPLSETYPDLGGPTP